jgi:hypothetical protein
MTSCQSPLIYMTHRYREQAHSYKVSGATDI